MSDMDDWETEWDRAMADVGVEQERWEVWWASLTPEGRERERAMMDAHADERRGES